MVRQLHYLIPDKKVLAEAFDNTFDAEACRRAADFVLYQEDELAALRAADQERGLPEGVPPVVLRPSFLDLLELSEGSTPGEVSSSPTPVEIPPEVVVAPASAELTSVGLTPSKATHAAVVSSEPAPKL